MHFVHISTLAFGGLVSVAGHGTVTLPAMRANPSVGRFCPWCQGSMAQCSQTTATSCIPPSPCWGATPGETVKADKFVGYFNKNPKHPDGSYWIDQAGGPDQKTPFWCPGTAKTIRYYINTDHNGVFRWETQRAEPGMETEEAFSNITSWVSVNNYMAYNGGPLTNYYNAININAEIPSGRCVSQADWVNNKENCLNDVFAETTLLLPRDLEPGKTVFRWKWLGATDGQGTRVDGPERSLFLSCLDVEVGTPTQCGGSGNSEVLV